MPWDKISHNFTHPELDYDAKPNFQPCIKVSVFFKKKDGIDFDTFFGHWQTVHADLALATKAFRNHIIRYAQVSPLNFHAPKGGRLAIFLITFCTQHHQTPLMKERARSLGENVLDYDGCAQLWVRSWDDWMGFYNSAEYAAALSDDCHRFMALPMTYMIGYENLVVGDANKSVGGSDGIDLTNLNR